MWTPRGAWPLIVAVALGAVLVLTPTASARPKAPGGLQPAAGVKVDRMPVFTWNPTKGADHYEFQLAADKGFNSTVGVPGSKQSTKNTAVTLPSSLINGTYWWRIRSVTATSATSAWTKGRTVVLKWAPVTNLTGPVDGTAFTTPAANPGDALVLSWAAMPGAAQYAVTVATDPLLTTVVTSGGNPAIVDGTSFTLDGSIPDGTYYWSVTPLDAEGHKGLASATRSVVVHWNASAGSPVVTDLATDPELMDPLFSWGTVLGASAYELEISGSADFAPGSKICCNGTTTATSLSPTALFPDNTYFWRVRPYDAANHPGPWTVGAPFTKTFDNVPPLVAPSVKNIHMRDMTDVGSDSSRTPVIMWDPVMGASEYQVEIDPFQSGSCNSSNHYGVFTTAVPAWAPQGSLAGQSPAIGNAGGASTDSNLLLNGQGYCVQVRAIDTDAGGNPVFGDWTLANNYTSPLFTYSTAAPTPTAPCSGWLCPSSYIAPVNTVESQTPTVFVWKPVTGAAGYYIVVSRDPNFTNILDYAFTNGTAYVPRHGGGAVTYADETAGSQLYWAVIPTQFSDGTGTGFGQPGLIAGQGNKQTFSKQSTPPTIQAPNVSGAGVSFQWQPQIGAAYYTLQVSADPSYSNILESVDTDSASYTAATSYPAGQTLYYRIRANDISHNGLAWATGVFTRSLAAPVASAPTGMINPATLDGIPIWSWSAIPGAVAYDVHVDYPNGTSKDVNAIQATSTSWSKLDGPGVWHWKVRAEFAKGGGGTLPGPYSATQTFTRTFGEPLGRRVVATKTRLIFSWEPKQGAKTYHLQVSANPDFSSTIDDVTQDAARFAPSLTSDGYVNGGRLFWHVAAVDAEGNQGDWSATSKVTLAKGMKIGGDVTPARGKSQIVTITVTNVKGVALRNVTVRVSGAGAVPRAKRTNKKGQVRLLVRPTSKGALIFRATKSGYQLTTLTDTIT